MGNVNSKEQEIGFSTEFFPSETGECNIAVHTWRPALGQSVRGVIQLVHGMSEYVRRFQPIAEYFVSLGYVFCGNDHAGHGDSIQQADKKGFFAAENGWNALVDADLQTIGVFFQGVTEHLRGLPGKIIFIRRNILRRAQQLPGLSGAHIDLDVIPDGNGLHYALQIMVAVLPLAQHIQRQIQFGRGPLLDAVHESSIAETGERW